jgi:hypothetical protein
MSKLLHHHDSMLLVLQKMQAIMLSSANFSSSLLHLQTDALFPYLYVGRIWSNPEDRGTHATEQNHKIP